jgi:hypothetical protein
MLAITQAMLLVSTTGQGSRGKRGSDLKEVRPPALEMPAPGQFQGQNSLPRTNLARGLLTAGLPASLVHSQEALGELGG